VGGVGGVGPKYFGVSKNFWWVKFFWRG